MINRSLLWVLALFGTVMLVGGTDMTKVTVALPALDEALSLGSLEFLWAADIYSLAAGVVLVASAVAADRYGRKRIYLLGLAVAIASALMAGLAPSGEVLIAARIGQGIGSALLIASTVSIIRVTFSGTRARALAYGVWTAGFSTGSALGPLLGGSLVDVMGWQWVFWINVPILLVCFLAAWKILKESTNPDPPCLDAFSLALSALAVGLLIAGLKGLTQAATPPWVSLVVIIAATVAAVVFVIRQLRLRRPFLDVRLFRNHLLAVSAVVIATTLGVFNGTLYLLLLRYQVIDGLTAFDAGIALLPLAVAMATGGLMGPLLQRWLIQQHVIVCGMTLVSAGSLIVTTPAMGEIVGMSMLGLGSGIVMASGANAVMSTASKHRAADAGAIQETAFALGAGTGIALLGVMAIHFGTTSTGGASAQTIYGPGTETALGLTAFIYTFFAIAASLIILSTRRSQTPTQVGSQPF